MNKQIEFYVSEPCPLPEGGFMIDLSIIDKGNKELLGTFYGHNPNDLKETIKNFVEFYRNK